MNILLICRSLGFILPDGNERVTVCETKHFYRRNVTAFFTLLKKYFGFYDWILFTDFSFLYFSLIVELFFFFGRGGGNKKQRQEKAIMEQVKN